MRGHRMIIQPYGPALAGALLALIGATTSSSFAQTVGPNGESATPASAITLTPEEEAEIKSGNYTAALAWHTASDYTAAVDRGAKEEFARLGIEVVAETDAQFDPAKQKKIGRASCREKWRTRRSAEE